MTPNVLGLSPYLQLIYALAESAHAGQTRRGTSVPYIEHPVRVWMMARALGMDEEAQAAALLHDVIEDCPGLTWAWLIKKGVNGEALHLIELLTKYGEFEDQSFVREFKPLYYSYICADPTALALKLLDRTDNMRDAALLVHTTHREWAARYLKQTGTDFDILLTTATDLKSTTLTAAVALFLGAYDTLSEALDPVATL